MVRMREQRQTLLQERSALAWLLQSQQKLAGDASSGLQAVLRRLGAIEEQRGAQVRRQAVRHADQELLSAKERLHVMQRERKARERRGERRGKRRF